MALGRWESCWPSALENFPLQLSNYSVGEKQSSDQRSYNVHSYMIQTLLLTWTHTPCCLMSFLCPHSFGSVRMLSCELRKHWFSFLPLSWNSASQHSTLPPHPQYDNNTDLPYRDVVVKITEVIDTRLSKLSYKCQTLLLLSICKKKNSLSIRFIFI